jgi:DNA polymerase elongation subunit (family B)
MANYNDIIALNHKETMVPYKICSFDIEASSSHGDFPIPIKTYKKLSINIIEYFEKYKNLDEGTCLMTNETLQKILKNIVLLAFGYETCDITEMVECTIHDLNNIERVYPITPPKSKNIVIELINRWLNEPVRNIFSDNNDDISEQMNIENMFEKAHKEMNSKDDDDEDETKDADKNTNNSESESGGGNGGFISVNEVTTVKKKTKLQMQNYNQTHTIVDIISEFINMGTGNGDSEDSDEPSISVKGTAKTGTTTKSTKSTKTTKSKNRDMLMQELTISLNKIFPKLEGDKITFIGSTFLKYGEKEPYMNHCAVLNTCDQIPAQNTIVESYKTEKDVLLAWKELIQKENPDIIIGYNIFGFDYEFMFRRAEENHCVEEFLQLSRNKHEICGDKIKYRDQNNGWHELDKYKIEESSLQIASGQHDLKYIKMNGRLQIDLYNYFRREENLSSYKLDYVAGHFIGDYVKKVEDAGESSSRSVAIHSGNLTGLQEGSFIHFEEIGHSTEYYDSGSKFKVASVDKENHLFRISIPETYHKNICTSLDFSKKIRWCLAKDDVTPKDIFKMTNGSDSDRAVIAKYCIQDCNLVHYLMNKVDILTGFSEMSKICSVPIHFLVSRGQGIKLTSYIAKKCREKNTLIPVIEKGNSDEGYEGAIVLDPKCDLYLDNPVACVDYASLYPSSMISENLSHDSKVWTKEYDLDGNLIAETGDKGLRVGENGNEEEYFVYDNLANYNYVDVKYDTYKYVRKTAKSAAEKIKSGYKCCRFAQSINRNERAIMPSILEELLASRKATRKLIPNEKDEFMKNVLDKRQLGYKLTANSLYGQCGAKTSTFYEKDVAASTTATGRLLLTYAKRVIEECYGDAICNTSEYGPVLTKAEYIYGDTDSVFFTFNLQTPDGEPIRGKKALDITIELAQEAGHLASSFLKGPHDLEYEKTFMPFCLLSKKRYVGMLYETDSTKCKRKEMGIVLKRRDNAPIVKDVYGGIIDILMKEKDIQKSIAFLKSCLRDIVEEKYPIEKLIITKSLRSGYKNPQQIAHKVLADRIMERDPGNKIGSGDRIPFVYIKHPSLEPVVESDPEPEPIVEIQNNPPEPEPDQELEQGVKKGRGRKKAPAKPKPAPKPKKVKVPKIKLLQGDKIETPKYIAEKNLKIDYGFYITNQIMKPVQQVFALVLEKIWKMQNKELKIHKFKQEIQDMLALYNNDITNEKYQAKLEQMKNKEVKALLFDEFLE